MPNGTGFPDASSPYRDMGKMPYYGTPEVPGANVLLQTVIQLLSAQGIRQTGMIPLAMGRENLYDRISDSIRTQQYDQLQRNLADRGRADHLRFFRGAVSSFGQPWDQPTQEFFSPIANFLATNARFIPPDILDIMGGRQGHIQAMAHHMFRGGRHRLDPQTGAIGLGAESAEELIRGVHGRMYGDPGDIPSRGTAGLTAGQMGKLFLVLQRRGMIAGPTTREETWDETLIRQLPVEQRMEIQEAVEEAATGLGRRAPRRRGVGREREMDWEAVGRDRPLLKRVMQDTRLDPLVQEFNTQQVVQSLERYSGAVKAMSEIFGDAGRPNAPFPELINALQVLTGGALTQFDPGRVETMIRKTYALAETAGVGLPGMLTLAERATAQAQQMNISPVFSGEAVQNALAYTAAYQAAGYGSFQAWGLADLPTLGRRQADLTMSAAGSRATNRLGAMRRFMAQNVVDGQSLLGPENVLRRYFGAYEANEETFRFEGRDVPIALTQSIATRMLRQSAEEAGIEDVNDRQIAQLFNQKSWNQEAATRGGDAIRVQRLMQLPDLMRRSADAAAWASRSMVSEFGLTGRQQKATALRLGELGTNIYFGMTAEEKYADPDEARAILGTRLREAIERAAADPNDINNVGAGAIVRQYEGNEPGFQAWAQRLAGTQRGNLERVLQDYGGAATAAALFDPGVAQWREAQDRWATTRGKYKRETARLGLGSPQRRFFDAIMSLPETGGGLSRVGAVMFGAESPGTVAGIIEELKGVAADKPFSPTERREVEAFQEFLRGKGLLPETADRASAVREGDVPATKEGDVTFKAEIGTLHINDERSTLTAAGQLTAEDEDVQNAEGTP